MLIAIDIDFTLTLLTEFFKEAISSFNSLILTSTIKEIGSRESNFKYRVNQLRKMNIKGGDYNILSIAEGKNQEEIGERKARICKLLGVDVLFDDDEVYIEKCERVTNVIKVGDRDVT